MKHTLIRKNSIDRVSSPEHIAQIFTYTPALVMHSLCVTLLTFVSSLLDTIAWMRHRRLRYRF